MKQTVRSESIWNKFNHPVVSMLAVAGLAFLLYARALGFAFFNDDPTGHFAWMEGQSLLRLFGTSEGFGYYRPLTFIIWKLLWLLLGGYYAPGFHVLPLLLHAVNAALVWLIAFYLSGRHSYAWLVALAFAAFPLSYEAVAYVAALFHPLLTLWVLLTLLLYRRARQSANAWHMTQAHISMLLALFTHENGLVIPVILLAWEFLTRPFRSLREALTRPVYAFFIAPILFGLLWFSISKSGEQGVRSLEDITANGLAFLQVLAVPFLSLFTLSPDDVQGLLMVAGAVVVCIFLLTRLAQARRLWFLALIWFVTASLPSILFLEPVYLYGSPRLYYLASIGAAFLWGIPLLAWAQLDTQPGFRRYLVRGVAVGFILVIILPSLPFINCQMDFFDEASRIVRQMRDMAQGAPAARDLVTVNVPFYFSSYPERPDGCSQTYPFAPVGAVVVPPYASVRDFVRVNGGPDRPAVGATFAGYDPGWTTHGQALSADALRQQLADSQVYVFDLNRGVFFDLNAAWKVDGTGEQEARAVFDAMIALEAATVDATDEQIRVMLQWRAIESPQHPLRVLVHLYDAAGALVSQHDGPPAENYAPVTLWQAGDVVLDTHFLPLEHPPAEGVYRLVAGWYDPATGDRLPAFSAQGEALVDDVVELEVLTWP